PLARVIRIKRSGCCCVPDLVFPVVPVEPGCGVLSCVRVTGGIIGVILGTLDERFEIDQIKGFQERLVCSLLVFLQWVGFPELRKVRISVVRIVVFFAGSAHGFFLRILGCAIYYPLTLFPYYRGGFSAGRRGNSATVRKLVLN